MANYNLTNQDIKDTFQQLAQVSGSIEGGVSGSGITDGTGSRVTNLHVTASSALNAGQASSAVSASHAVNADSSISSSYALTASFAENVTPIDTGSFMITGSASGDTITFTKADGTQFATTILSVTSSLQSEDLFVNVKNTSGDTIAKGFAVHATGVTGENINIKLADSSVSGDMPAIGLLEETITNNSTGRAIIAGRLKNIDTSALVAGAPVYVGTGGALTSTKPIGANLIQNIGVAGKINASDGEIILQGAGRSNDLPNLVQDYVWKGDSNGVPEAVAQSTLSVASAVSSSYALSASYAVSASVEIIQEVSSSYAETATSASYALTASFVEGSIQSASFAATASYVNPLNQDVTLSGSFNFGDKNDSINWPNATSDNTRIQNVDASGGQAGGLDIQNTKVIRFDDFNAGNTNDIAGTISNSKDTVAGNQLHITAQNKGKFLGNWEFDATATGLITNALYAKSVEAASTSTTSDDKIAIWTGGTASGSYKYLGEESGFGGIDFTYNPGTNTMKVANIQASGSQRFIGGQIQLGDTGSGNSLDIPVNGTAVFKGSTDFTNGAFYFGDQLNVGSAFNTSGGGSSVNIADGTSVNINADMNLSASKQLIGTASYAMFAQTTSGTITNADTASFVNPLTQSVDIDGGLTVTGSTDIDGVLSLPGIANVSASIAAGGGGSAFPFTGSAAILGTLAVDGATPNLSINQGNSGGTPNISMYNAYNGTDVKFSNFTINDTTGTYGFPTLIGRFSNAVTAFGNAAGDPFTVIAGGAAGGAFNHWALVMDQTGDIKSLKEMNMYSGAKVSGSLVVTGSQEVTGSLKVTGDITGSANLNIQAIDSTYLTSYWGIETTNGNMTVGQAVNPYFALKVGTATAPTRLPGIQIYTSASQFAGLGNYAGVNIYDGDYNKSFVGNIQNLGGSGTVVPANEAVFAIQGGDNGDSILGNNTIMYADNISGSPNFTKTTKFNRDVQVTGSLNAGGTINAGGSIVQTAGVIQALGGNGGNGITIGSSGYGLQYPSMNIFTDSASYAASGGVYAAHRLEDRGTGDFATFALSTFNADDPGKLALEVQYRNDIVWWISEAQNRFHVNKEVKAVAGLQATGSVDITGSLSLNGTPITGGGGSAFPFVGDAEITGSLNISGSVTGNIATPPLTSSGGTGFDFTASLDFNQASFFNIALDNGSTYHFKPYNMQPGQTVTLRVPQAPDGNGAVGWSPEFKFPGGNTPVATQGSGAEDIYTFVTFDTGSVYTVQTPGLA